MRRVITQTIAGFVLIGLVLTAYVIWARPYQLHWGATADEIARPMPGDELDPRPTFLATRAITIDATPAEIWPWLLQMGYGRAGFYGFDVLENLGSPRGLSSADRILPEFQNFRVGDKVPLSAAAEEVFYAIEPNQYLIWAGQTGPYPGGFTWALYPVDETHTRLVSRIRWHYHTLTQPGMLFLDVFTEFTDHLAVRKILLGVKGRVEGRIEPAAFVNAEFTLYVAAALIFFTSFLLILVLPFTWRRGLASLAAGAVWLCVWYAPLPIGIDPLLLMLVVGGLYQAFRQTSPPSPANQ